MEDKIELLKKKILYIVNESVNNATQKPTLHNINSAISQLDDSIVDLQKLKILMSDFKEERIKFIEKNYIRNEEICNTK